MSEISIEVTGDMAPTPNIKKSNLANFLQHPLQVPDPKEWLSQQRQNVRPWLQFVQTTHFKVPPSVPRLSKRIVRNIEYFQSNYVFVFLGLVIYCLITSPLLLIALAATFFCGYKISRRHAEKKLQLMGKELSLAQVYALLWLCSMPIFYLVGATSAMFWVIGASFTLIMLHASFYNIEALISSGEEGFGLVEEV